MAKIFYWGLRGVEGNINKENIIDGIKAIKGLDIGLGLPISYNNSENQAIHKLWLTHIHGNDLVAFSWDMMRIVK